MKVGDLIINSHDSMVFRITRISFFLKQYTAVNVDGEYLTVKGYDFHHTWRKLTKLEQALK